MEAANTRRDPLVTSKRYLFVQICRLKNSPGRPNSLISIEAVLGSHTSYKTRPLKKSTTKEDECNHVIALPISGHPQHPNPDSLEIRLLNNDTVVASILFDNLSIDPIIDTTKSPAPQWHKLWNDRKLTAIELLLATWFSTNQHEAFRKSNLWNSAPVVYIQPTLWYLRISFQLLRDQQDVIIQPATLVTLSLPPTILCSLNLLRALKFGYILLPAAEPLQSPLHISIFLADALLFEKKVPMSDVNRRISGHVPESKMCVVTTGVAGLRLTLTLEGGYHFFDEPARNSSDFRPSAPKLQPPPVAHLDLCFKEADFLPMESGHSAVSSPYCVAKYGGKWAKTSYQSGPRPSWDDEFSWSVYDPCTVITIAVFDRNGRGGGERVLGKLRVRLSTMRSGHSYDQLFALWVLEKHNGMVNTGFIRLCMRLTPVSWFSLLIIYRLPLWPKLHYEDPLNPLYVNMARLDACEVIAEYMDRAVPPLPKEVVRYVLKGEQRMWVGRKTRSLHRRLGEALLPLRASVSWLSKVRRWENMFDIVCIVIVCLFLFFFPQTIPYIVVVWIIVMAVWNYCFMRPVQLPGINPCLSLGRPSCSHGCNHAYMREMKDMVDEVDPFSWVPERVKFEDTEVEMSTRHIFEEARSHLFLFQECMDGLVGLVERMKSLISWRDPRATGIFMAYVMVKVGVQYGLSIPLWGVLWIHLMMMTVAPVLLGHVTPSFFVNFFRRLPTRCETIL